MLENTWSVGARCLLQSHVNSQQAAWHSHITGKSLGSSHSSHRCIITSQTNFGYITVMYELLGCFFAASDWCLHSLQDFQPPWLYVTFPWECGCRAQCCPFSLIVNQHSYQVHLTCLSSSYPCTWTLLGPWFALPAGGRQCTSNVVQRCIYAHPRPKPSLPASLWEHFVVCRQTTEKVHKIAVLAVIIMGLCDITGDWSFSSDQDNCCAEWMWEKSLPNCVRLSSISQSSLCAQKMHYS